MLDYIGRNYKANGLPIGFLPSGVLIRAFVRLNAFHLLDKIPDPITVQPEPTKEDYLDRLEKQRESERLDEQSRTGRDYLTGEPKVYTKAEDRRLTSEQIRKAYQPFKHGNSMGDLFDALRGQRKGQQ